MNFVMTSASRIAMASIGQPWHVQIKLIIGTMIGAVVFFGLTFVGIVAMVVVAATTLTMFVAILTTTLHASQYYGLGTSTFVSIGVMFWAVWLHQRTASKWSKHAAKFLFLIMFIPALAGMIQLAQ